MRDIGRCKCAVNPLVSALKELGPIRRHDRLKLLRNRPSGLASCSPVVTVEAVPAYPSDMLEDTLSYS
jgi:hypothetical protein